MKTETLARKYIVSNGHKPMELIKADDGRLMVVVNCDDSTRQPVSIDDARAFWDAAPYRIGARP